MTSARRASKRGSRHAPRALDARGSSWGGRSGPGPARAPPSRPEPRSEGAAGVPGRPGPPPEAGAPAEAGAPPEAGAGRGDLRWAAPHGARGEAGAAARGVMPGLRRSTSGLVFGALLAAAVGLQCALRGAVGVLWSIVLVVWVSGMTIFYLCTPRLRVGAEKEVAAAADAEAAPLLPAVGAGSGQDPGSEAEPRGERLHFLDNLKVALTILVVTHHQGCSFIGSGWYFNIGNYGSPFQAVVASSLMINQSWFMCAFFFVSGYFTPSSFDRKGRQNFLADKFIRLGIPFLVFSYVLGPLLGLMVQHFEKREVVRYNSTPNPGPLWFAGWLLVFNSVYAVTDHSRPFRMRMTSPTKWLACCFPIQVLQVALIATSGGTFAFMPISVGSLPFDALYFYAGCTACRNGWLDLGTEGGLGELMANHRRWIQALLAGACLWSIAYTLYLSYAVPDFSVAAAYVQPMWDFSVLFFCSTAICALMLMAQLDLFYRRFSFTGRWSKLLSSVSYTVYIIHPFFVVLASGAFIAVYEGCTGREIRFEQGFSTSATVLEPGWLWGGFLCCSLLSVTASFVAAHWLRELLPGAKRVL